MTSGLPQAAAAPSRNCAQAGRRAAHPALVGELEDALGARVDRPVHGMSEAGQALARLPDGRRHRRGDSAGSSPAATRARAVSSRSAHASAVPRMTGPAPQIPAATAPCSEFGSAASVIRAATFVGIIPCSAIATSSRSRKKRWSSVGSRPVSSRWKYSVKLRLPHQLAAEVAAAHLNPVGVGLADVGDGAPAPRRHRGRRYCIGPIGDHEGVTIGDLRPARGDAGRRRHDRADSHRSQLVEALAIPSLTTSAPTSTCSTCSRPGRPSGRSATARWLCSR